MKTLFIFIFIFASHVASTQGKFSGGNGDGFAAAALTNVVLPVEKLNFSGNRNGQDVLLHIAFISTEAVRLIVLERSTDGVRFDPSDSVVINFSEAYDGQVRFRDQFVTERMVYYRIKLIVMSGEKNYSSILSFRSEGAMNSFTLLVPGNLLRYSVNTDGFLEVINCNGQLVKRIWVTKGAGTIQLPSLIKGIYLLRFQLEEPVKILVQ